MTKFEPIAVDPRHTAHDAAIDAAVLTVPPLWPLASSVAVNPFLGQAGEPLEQAAARLARMAGVAITMPRAWYAGRLATGAMIEGDLAAALSASDWAGRPQSVEELRRALERQSGAPSAIPTVADLAAQASGIDWSGIIAERIGHWAAGYFDQGQALWNTGHVLGAYRSWRETATNDLTPELLGLPGFARFVAGAPETAKGALARSVMTLGIGIGIGSDALEGCLARALTTLCGWGQYARFLRFEAELGNSTDDTAIDLLAIRLLWEEALFERYQGAIARGWKDALAAHAAPITPTEGQRIDAILQHAAELGVQRKLSGQLAERVATPDDGPAIQAAFCIDVRSERFRRALEATDPEVRTLGFAGFFGLATAHRRFASDVVEKRLPVLLNPGTTSVAGGTDLSAADRMQRYRARASRAWGRFKLAAVSSFAFVEATGPVYMIKLMRDAVGRGGRALIEPAPRLEPPLPLEAQIDAAENILRAMSLSTDFARLVMIIGHGATVANNPHSSALQCGACGGFAGDVNARLLASLLNDREVRAGLKGRAIDIPPTTLFVGALHDTTSDRVTVYDGDQDGASHRDDLARAHTLLDRAGLSVRIERAPQLPNAGVGGGRIVYRAHDWAQTRPEWGLAGARAFLAAPRERSVGRSFEGQVFLHDYDWKLDEGFVVLELILTAPVVVASWISLQYYGSVVAPTLFGGGNKLLHNITGGLGVVEGNGGVLRGGLPWQSVHNGEHFLHDPLRLTVCVEAPSAAIDAILTKHDHVRALFDNRWLHLLQLDETGILSSRVAHGDWPLLSSLWPESGND